MTTEDATCPDCAAPLSEDAPEGLCPECLLRQALLDTVDGPPPAPGLSAGERIGYLGDYELVGELGRGGMGVVYEARQRSLERTVAVKLLLGGAWSAPEMIERFRTEARAAASLKHPNIVAVHEIGEQDGQPFFSMDYVAGSSLEDLVRAGGAEPGRAARLVRDVARAIDAAHDQGILHRDLKPSNVLLDEADQPHVTDFGLAKYLSADQGLTNTGEFLGTPGYMPPEQVRSVGAEQRRASRASDVYSLGAILYALMTGRPPFRGESALETALEVLRSEPPAPRRLDPSLPRDLETVCLKCLARDPAERYASAGDLAEDLERFLSDLPVAARRARLPERSWRWLLRHRRPVLAALLLVALGFAAATRMSLGRFEAFLAQARAMSYSGDHDGAFEALAAAGRFRRNAELRGAAIEALTAPAARRVRSFPLSAGHGIQLSADGRFVAATGRHGSSWQERTAILVWDLEAKDGTFTEVPAEAPQFAIDGTRLLVYDAEHLWGGGPARSGHSWRGATGEVKRALAIWNLRSRPDEPKAQETPARILGRPDSGRFSTGPLVLSPGGNLLARRHARHDGLGRPEIWHLEDGSIEPVPISGRPLAFSGESRLLIAACGGLAVWDLERQELTTPWSDEPLLAISADASVAAFEGASGSLELWDLPGRRVLGSLEPPGSGSAADPDRLLLSRDGRRIALASRQHDEIRVWDLSALAEAPRVLRVPPGGSAFPELAAFSPEASMLAAFGSEAGHGLVWIWDVAAGRRGGPPVAELRDQSHPAWSHGGRLITTGDLRVELGPRRSFGPTRLLTDVAGREVSVGSGAVNVWELFPPIPAQTLTQDVASIAFHPDGDRLTANEIVWRISVRDGRHLLHREAQARVGTAARFDSRGRLWQIAKSPMDSGVPYLLSQLAPDPGAPRLKRAAYSSQRPLPVGATGHFPRGDHLELSPDGRTVAILSSLWTARRRGSGSGGEALFELWDLDSGQRLHSFAFDEGLAGDGDPAISPDGRYVAAGQRLFEAASGRLIRELEHHYPQWQTVFSPDGSRLYSDGFGRSIVEIDVATGRIARSWKAGHVGVRALALSPDGRLLASGGETREIALWDASNGRELARWPAHAATVTALAFRPQGLLLASGGADGLLKLWDLERIHEELERLDLEW